MIDTGAWIEIASAWVLTYVVHSTLLLVAAWLSMTLVRRMTDRVKETLWKGAIVGGLVTATAQLGFGIPPVTGRFIALETAPDRDVVHEFQEREEVAGSVDAPVEAGIALSQDDPMETDQADLAMSMLSAHDEALSEVKAGDDTTTPWTVWVVFGAAGFGVMGMMLLATARLRQGRQLADRQAVRDGAAWRLLEELREEGNVRRTVRLSSSHRLATPIAFGVFRPEICLPQRALDDLDESLLRPMIAHELGHVVRRDAHWLVVCRTLEQAFAFQPLNRLASRRLREIAEYGCDAWAANRTGSSLPLARCLTEVASWLVQAGNGRKTSLASAMASNPSVLKQRVDRLLDGMPDDQSVGGGRRRAVLAVVVLAMLTVVAPGVALSRSRAVLSEEPKVAEPFELALPTDDAMAVDEVVPEPAKRSAPAEAAEALALLNEELDALDAEIVVLRRVLGSRRIDARTRELLRQLEDGAAQLQRRRASIEQRIKQEMSMEEPTNGPLRPGR